MRDVFIANPRMTDPKILRALEFVGALMGQRVDNTEYPIHFPFAPTFWIQLLGQETTLKDFSHENNRLYSLLSNLDESLANNEVKWSWTDSLLTTKKLGSHNQNETVSTE